MISFEKYRERYGTSKVTGVSIVIFIPAVELIIIGFSVLDAAVVLVAGGRFSSIALFAPLRVVGEGVVLRAEEAT